MKNIKKQTKKLNEEAKNIWNLTSLLVEILAAAVLVDLALDSSGLLQYALAVASAVFAVNVLAKLRKLTR